MENPLKNEGDIKGIFQTGKNSSQQTTLEEMAIRFINHDEKNGLVNKRCSLLFI